MKKAIVTKGKRKRSIAKATLYPGKGQIRVNGQLLQNYGNGLLRLRISEPLVLASDVSNQVDIDVIVRGGGVTGQADAARLAVARSLVQHDNKLKKVFESYDRLLLVADVRNKEQRKPNDSKARAARQKSYR